MRRKGKVRFRPRRSKTTTRSFSRKFARRRSRGKPVTKVYKGSLVAADRTRVKLAYNAFYNLSAATGTPFDQVFQSSANDPDFTGTGNQPLGYDEWSAFYNYYRVLGIAYDVEFASTNSSTPVSLIVVPTLSSATPTAIAALSLPYSKTRTVGQAGGMSRARVKGFMSTRKINGMKSIEFEDNFGAPIGSDPNDKWYIHVMGYAGASAAPTGFATIKMTYYIEFYERKTLAIS